MCAYLGQSVFFIFLFLLGLCVGSFLNVCIYRMPRDESVIRPRSHCTKCNRIIKWYYNIPLVSFIVLLGRCRYCKEKISFQYFIVEFLTGFLFAAIGYGFGVTPQAFVYIVFVCALIIATFVDFNFRIIPDEISVGGIVAGLVFSFIFPHLHGQVGHLLGFWHSLLGVFVGGGVIWIVGIAGDFIFKKETMGGGDVKLLGMIGAFLGWKYALLTFFIAPFFGLIVGVIVKLRTKSSLIAYGPYLSLASIIVLFFGNDILNWVLYR